MEEEKHKEQRSMIEKVSRSKRGSLSEGKESSHEDLKRYEKPSDPEALLFIAWASSLYEDLSTKIPRTYFIEADDDVLQNPEHVTWREKLKSLRSNLESRLKEHERIESDRNISADRMAAVHQLYDKVLELEHKSHEGEIPDTIA